MSYLKSTDFIIFKEANPSYAKSQLGMQTAFEILQKSTKYFVKNGFESDNLSLLSKKIKISRTTILNHYHSIEDLRMGCFKYSRYYYQHYVVEKMKVHEEPEKKFQAYFDSMFEWPKKNPTFASMWMFFLYRTTLNESYKKLNIEAVQIGYERIIEMLKAYNRNRSEDNLRTNATVIHTLITGQLWSEQCGTESYYLPARKIVWNQCLTLFKE